MTGRIFAIKRMEIHDGEGLRTTVFFKGCPLRCIWCHNPEGLLRTEQIAFFEDKCIGCGTCKGMRDRAAAERCPVSALVSYGTEYDVKTLADVLCADREFFLASGGGVTFSGGECLLQPDFAVALAKELFHRGISVFVDTCGLTDEGTLNRIIPYTDKFLYDIKAIDPALHKRCTGQDNAQILQNLTYISQKGCKIEIRYPLLQGLNDTECEPIARFLKGMKGIEAVKVLQYHTFAASKYKALGMPCAFPALKTTYEDVVRAVNVFKKHGLPAINGMDGE